MSAGRPARAGLVAAVLVSLSLLSLTACKGPRTIDPAGGARPRLAVLVVFDQLRGDYLTRWQDLFEEGGFRRLQNEGAWFPNCHFPYAATLTAPGHASILTGCPPARHGVIENEWYDRAAGEVIYCVSSERYQLVPPAPGSGRDPKPKAASPERLLVPSLGDALKEATGGRGRVVSLSFKDRSAVLPGGHRADACYWLDTDNGLFTTSTYYRDRPHPWVEEFNRRRPADYWFGRDWNRLRTDLNYERYSGPDDGPGEGRAFAQGRTFPHPMTGGLKQPGKDYYQALFTSPFGNDLLLDLAK